MNKITQKNENVALFKLKLAEYKQAIDADIAKYCKYVQETTLRQYGEYARLESDAFLDILSRGGKRIRGALVMVGYEMCGGKDTKMIAQAARATEMFNAYLLIIDDIQDRSTLRRAGPAAHIMLANYHKKNGLAGDPAHFGVSIAINSALSGAHAAQMILANLDAPEDLRIKVLGITNRTMAVTLHGQTYDMMNEITPKVTSDNIERVLEWKTAHYTVLNPLHVGMVLAGADCHATDAITPYAIHTGKAFQITDDIIGTFGHKDAAGKNPMDDVREGKQTVLTHYALEHTKSKDKKFISEMLGNGDITKPQFEQYKGIIKNSGALEYAHDKVTKHIAQAILDLKKHRQPAWPEEPLQFLIGLAKYIESNERKT